MCTLCYDGVADAATYTPPTITTPHGSTLIALSDILTCPACGDVLARVRLPSGYLAWECQAPTCGHTLALGAITPAPAAICNECGGAHITWQCPNIARLLFAAPETCTSCGDPLYQTGLCQACQEAGETPAAPTWRMMAAACGLEAER